MTYLKRKSRILALCNGTQTRNITYIYKYRRIDKHVDTIYKKGASGLLRRKSTIGKNRSWWCIVLIVFFFTHIYLLWKSAVLSWNHGAWRRAVKLPEASRFQNIFTAEKSLVEENLFCLFYTWTWEVLKVSEKVLLLYLALGFRKNWYPICPIAF